MEGQPKPRQHHPALGETGAVLPQKGARPRGEHCSLKVGALEMMAEKDAKRNREQCATRQFPGIGPAAPNETPPALSEGTAEGKARFER